MPHRLQTLNRRVVSIVLSVTCTSAASSMHNVLLDASSNISGKILSWQNPTNWLQPANIRLKLYYEDNAWQTINGAPLHKFIGISLPAHPYFEKKLVWRITLNLTETAVKIKKVSFTQHVKSSLDAVQP